MTGPRRSTRTDQFAALRVPRATAEPLAHATPAARDEASADAARLEAAIRDDFTGFSFFQLIRLLGQLRPARAPLGEWADPTDEVARLGVTSSLAFPTSEVESLTLPPRDDAVPVRMRVNFLGLTGSQGVLPQRYSEHSAERARARDTAFRDFLDLFHHRLLSLFYRAWEQTRFPVAAEAGHEDRLYDHLLDLAGLGLPELRRRLPVRDEALAFYSGPLAMRTRPADGLARLVGDYFDVPTTIEQFVGEWRHVGDAGQATLGGDDLPSQLGFGVLGAEMWDPQARVRLRLGPLTREQFDAFLPGGVHYEALRALADLYADTQVGVDAQLVLSRDAITPFVLRVPGDDESGVTRLGRGSWLVSRPAARDADETVLQLC